jgi:hypothetical protein
MMLESDNLPSKKKTKKKKMKKTTTTKKKIGVEASEQGISSAEGTHTTDRRYYFSCLPQERKIQQQTSKQTNNINQSVLHEKGEDAQCLSAGLSKAQGSLQNTYCHKVSSADYLQSRQNRAAVRSFVVLVCRLRSGSSSTCFVSSIIIISSLFYCSECSMASLRDVCVRVCVRVCLSLRLWFRQPSPLLFLISLCVASQSASSC